MKETCRLGVIPYHGSHTDHRPNATLRTYGSDQSGRKRYTFNSFGYRGPEPSAAATACILTSGCSYTIGEGLDYHEAWPSGLAARYAAHRGIEPAQVNLLNLAQGGASNDYIARTVLPHVARVQPDLVAILFTYKNRAEIVLDDPGHPPLVGSLGPWVAKADMAHRELPADKARRTSLLIEGASHYYHVYSEDSGLINALKNMLLVQFACRAASVPHVFGWVEHGLLESLPEHPNPIVRSLAACLDRACFCDTALTDHGLKLDLAADGTHPGVASNAAFAADLFDCWTSL